jgi:hypothetical protein
MSAPSHTMDQIRELRGLEVGQSFSLVITNAQSACTLEFLHAHNPEWVPYPAFAGNPVDGVILAEHIRCVSGRMRIKFANPPTEKYYASIVTHALARY